MATEKIGQRCWANFFWTIERGVDALASSRLSGRRRDWFMKRLAKLFRRF